MSLLFCVACLFAQDRHDRAPQKVQQTFQRDYPQASDATWSKSNNQWHAQFTDKSPNDDGEMVAHYSQNGKHISSTIPYDDNDVPAAVVKRVHSKYRNAKDYRYTRIDQPNGTSLFQVLLNIGGTDKTIYLDEQGKQQKYVDRH